MESPKYSRSDAFVIHPDKTTTIYEYPSQTKALRISVMDVKGKRPAEPGVAFLEHDCTFSIYVLAGSAKITIDGQVYKINKDDVVTVLAGKKWMLEGEITYITATTPAFYPEQSETVKI